MCLLAFAWQAHPRYRLIFAGNRDEFHARPAAAADWWPADIAQGQAVFGGRDLEAGGSWLGIRPDGRFAVITNFREPDRRPVGKRSRGEIVAGFLSGEAAVQDWLALLRQRDEDYAGFNLIFGDINSGELFYYSNRADDALALPPGLHALSNHLLNTPWPKVRRLHERFEAVLAQDTLVPATLLALLDDTAPATDSELPRTGVSLDWERRLSAARIVGTEYGTRASTVVIVDKRGDVHFHERRFDVNGEIAGDTETRFDAR